MNLELVIIFVMWGMAIMCLAYLDSKAKERFLQGNHTAASMPASKSGHADSSSASPAKYPWGASHWNEYMRKEGWKAYPCAKHAVEYCKECTEYIDRSDICCQ